jgi:hypothetical protein
MIRGIKSAVFASILALAGVAATADRSAAQEYLSYSPAPGYYSTPAQAGTYWTPYTLPTLPSYSSYYTPAADPNAAYTPVRAWDGGWTISGYTSPAIPYYNNYRATRR